MTSKHTYEKHEKCERHHCPICDGGLASCTVCRGFEGSLPSECPGQPMNEATQDSVYNDALDFRGGQWVDTRGLL